MPATSDTRSTMLDIFFPGINSHVKSPEVPYQYTGGMWFDDATDIEHIHVAMMKICSWCRENLSDSWYIRRDGFVYTRDGVVFEFNFAEDTDQMAFKLRWS